MTHISLMATVLGAAGSIANATYAPEPATDTQLECARKIAYPGSLIAALIARIDAAEEALKASQLTQDGAVAWRYKRLGRPNWNVTNNADLVDGLPAKGSHTIEALGVIAPPAGGA